jgi:hypothetical protein
MMEHKLGINNKERIIEKMLERLDRTSVNRTVKKRKDGRKTWKEELITCDRNKS